MRKSGRGSPSILSKPKVMMMGHWISLWHSAQGSSRHQNSLVIITLVICIALQALALGIIPDAVAEEKILNFDYAFEGHSPPLPNSEAVLVLDTENETVGFYSNDPILGTVNTGIVSPDYWRKINGQPARIIFQIQSSTGAIRGNVLLEPYHRAVVDAASVAGRVRYLLDAGCACVACIFTSDAAVGTASTYTIPSKNTSDISFSPIISTFGVTASAKYYFLGIANEDTDKDNNDEIVKWLKSYANWKDLKTYSGEQNGDKTAPIWLFDNQNGEQIGQLLDNFKAQHTITKDDVVLFYYSGHMSLVKDDEGDEGGSQDEVLFKSGSKKFLRDDALATKIQALGADDATTQIGTLRVVILDTCFAENFLTGKKDLKTVKNIAFLYSTSKTERSYSAKWHDSILKVKTIKEIDKGIDRGGGFKDDAKNNRVNFDEWAKWTIEIAKQGHIVPAYQWMNFFNSNIYVRPVVKK